MATVTKLSDKKYTYKEYCKWDGEWEIIDGTAYAMSPSASTKHQIVSGNIYYKFRQYLQDKPCKTFSELDVLLSDENVVRPDILIICDKNKIMENNIQGSPDLVVEILSPSTRKIDLIIKLNLYKKFGVKEYWIVDPLNLTITSHIFKNNTFISYVFDDSTPEDTIPVDIFNGDLNILLKDIFEM
jgi:Uma2 family endonuclease